MFGLIKKDFFIIKNNYKSLLLILAIFLFCSFSFSSGTVDFDGSLILFFLPFMGFLICTSTISYDDYNNWHAYAASLPTGKSGVIKSKYLTAFATIFLLTLLGILLTLILSSLSNTEIGVELWQSSAVSFSTVLFMISVLYPILFKFGAEKGRIATIILSLIIFSLVMFLTQFSRPEIPEDFLLFLENFFPLISLLISAGLFTVSYFISKKIYKNKGF